MTKTYLKCSKVARIMSPRLHTPASRPCPSTTISLLSRRLTCVAALVAWSDHLG